MILMLIQIRLTAGDAKVWACPMYIGLPESRQGHLTKSGRMLDDFHINRLIKVPTNDDVVNDNSTARVK